MSESNKKDGGPAKEMTVWDAYFLAGLHAAIAGLSTRKLTPAEVDEIGRPLCANLGRLADEAIKERESRR